MNAPPATPRAGVARRTHRLFLALVPAPEALQRITELGQRVRVDHGLAAPLVAPERLHLTLCFLGDHAGLPESLLGGVCAAAQTVHRAPFEVALDRVASFSRARGRRPLVLRGGDGVTGAVALHESLREALAHQGLDLPAAPAYTPHVTLMYDEYTMAETKVPTITWTAREFVLVQSLIGRGSHEVLKRWPLQPHH